MRTLDETRVAEICRLTRLNAEFVAALKWAKSEMGKRTRPDPVDRAIAKAEANELDAVGRSGGPSAAGSLPSVSPQTLAGKVWENLKPWNPDAND